MNKPLDKEIEHLRREIASLKKENKILRKKSKEHTFYEDAALDDKLFRMTFENASDGICIIKLEDGVHPKIVNANKVALKNHGYTLEEVKKTSFYDVVLGEAKEKITEGLEKLLKGESLQFEASFVRKDGKKILLEISSRLIHIHDVPYIYFIERDTGEQNKVMEHNKKALEAVQESEENYRLLFYDSPLAIYIANPKGEIIDANKTLLNLLGSPSLKATKQINILKFKPLVDIGYAEKFREALQKGETIRADMFYRSKWGKSAYLSSTIAPIKNNKGVYDRVYTVMEDITQRKIVEKALIKSKEELQKLNSNLKELVDAEVRKNREKDRMMIIQAKQAAMGEMIGNIAHQWRQPLNDIGLTIQDLQDSYEYNEFSEESLKKAVDQVMNRLHYMSQTIDDFRNFFRSDKEKVRFSLSHSIHRSFSLVRASYKNSYIDIIFAINDDIYYKGYPNEFSQAVLNILNNARDVLVERKTKRPLVKVGLEYSGNDIVITIFNNGGAIPNDIIEKVFEPYFTTKEKLRGTGLGLYISKTIIERNMGGSLTVRNVSDGVEFVIILSEKDEND